MTKIFWSKYGGARASVEEELIEWNCQSCGQRQYYSLPQYSIKNEFNEIFRICALCKNRQVKKNYTNIREIIRNVRFEEISYVENLITLPIR